MEGFSGMLNKDKDYLNGLIASLKRNEAHALSVLFDNYYEKLYIFAEKFIYDPDKAHDIVQELFVHLWENRATLTITSSLSHYLFTAVRNRCLNYLRSLRIEDLQNQRYLEAHIDSYTLDVVEEQEALEQLKRMIEQLPPQCRTIVELRILKGLKYKEIARQMNVSENVVKVQIHRAYQKLSTLKCLFPAGFFYFLLKI